MRTSSIFSFAKSFVLRATGATGLNRRLSRSEWRRKRLLILCYHSISQDDEHQWNPGLYMSPQTFERRLRILRDGGYSVLPLAEAWQRLTEGNLPPKAVVLTFDDGTCNFHSLAVPLLTKYGYPATVYLRTDYCGHQHPVFPPVVPYLLWKQRHRTVPENPGLGWEEPQDLRTEDGRTRAWSHLQRVSQERDGSLEARAELVAQLATHIGINYEDFLRRRILQIMNPGEVVAVAEQGMDVQLHTHNHRELTAVQDEAELRLEIEENRNRIIEMTGRNPVHFCYPSGRYKRDSLPALRKLGVVTATTCEPRLATSSSDPLLLPRFVDTDMQPEAHFEAWLSGSVSVVAGLRARTANNTGYSHPL